MGVDWFPGGPRCGIPNICAPTLCESASGSYRLLVCALRTNVQILNSMATLGCPFGDSQRTLCNCFKMRDAEVAGLGGPVPPRPAAAQAPCPRPGSPAAAAHPPAAAPELRPAAFARLGRPRLGRPRLGRPRLGRPSAGRPRPAVRRAHPRGDPRNVRQNCQQSMTADRDVAMATDRGAVAANPGTPGFGPRLLGSGGCLAQCDADCLYQSAEQCPRSRRGRFSLRLSKSL